jgi:hypothetical protein
MEDGTRLQEERGSDVCVHNKAHVRHPADRALL